MEIMILPMSAEPRERGTLASVLETGSWGERACAYALPRGGGQGAIREVLSTADMLSRAKSGLRDLTMLHKMGIWESSFTPVTHNIKNQKSSRVSRQLNFD